MGLWHGCSLVKRGGGGEAGKIGQVRHSFGIRATTNRLGMMSRTGSGLGQQEAENKHLWG
jgi:hypothetical protein